MTILIALVLSGVLLARLGFFIPWLERKTELAFESRVSLLGEEAAWDERMTRLSVRLANHEPQLFLRPRRNSHCV